MFTPLIFLLILSILVFVHEAGHFFAAKKSGILVEEFGFGYPPRIFGFKHGETLYSINALPFGGFVRLFGESSEHPSETQTHAPKNRAFYAKPSRIKAIIIAAGVVMNFILAAFVFSVAYSLTGIPVETDQVKVVEVEENSPAQAAGFRVDDQILAIGSAGGEMLSINSTNQFVTLLTEHLGEQVTIQIKRDNQELTLISSTRTEVSEQRGPLGIVISSVVSKFFPLWQMPFRGIWEGFKEALTWGELVIKMLFITLFRLITRGEVAESLAGPIEIYRLTGEVVQFGFIPLIRFLGILSVNLAVVNILPLPVFDGGRLVVVFIEAIRGKRLGPSFERVFNTVGVAMIIILFLLITLNDIIRIFGKEAFFSKISHLLPI